LKKESDVKAFITLPLSKRYDRRKKGGGKGGEKEADTKAAQSRRGIGSRILKPRQNEQGGKRRR